MQLRCVDIMIILGVLVILGVLGIGYMLLRSLRTTTLKRLRDYLEDKEEPNGSFKG